MGKKITKHRGKKAKKKGTKRQKKKVKINELGKNT